MTPIHPETQDTPTLRQQLLILVLLSIFSASSLWASVCTNSLTLQGFGLLFAFLAGASACIALVELILKFRGKK